MKFISRGRPVLLSDATRREMMPAIHREKQQLSESFRAKRVAVASPGLAWWWRLVETINLIDVGRNG